MKKGKCNVRSAAEGTTSHRKGIRDLHPWTVGRVLKVRKCCALCVGVSPFRAELLPTFNSQSRTLPIGPCQPRPTACGLGKGEGRLRWGRGWVTPSCDLIPGRKLISRATDPMQDIQSCTCPIRRNSNGQICWLPCLQMPAQLLQNGPFWTLQPMPYGRTSLRERHSRVGPKLLLELGK